MHTSTNALAMLGYKTHVCESIYYSTVRAAYYLVQQGLVIDKHPDVVCDAYAQSK